MLILYVKFNSPLPSHVQLHYLEQIPHDQAGRILKFRRWQDQHASLFGRLLLMKGLGHFGLGSLGISDLEYTKYGKPYLKGNVNFNIAHSNEYALCAFVEKGEIGVDIEYIEQDINIRDFEMVFSDREMNEILESDNPVETFYFYWSLKESVIKADGRGLSAPVKEIILNENTAMLEHKLFHVRRINLDPRYKASIASDHPIQQYKLVQYDARTLEIIDQQAVI